MLKAVLFDLDGTLLPIDLDAFYKEYFRLLCTKLAGIGYTDPKLLVKTVMQGVGAVERNDGSMLNEELFWSVFHRTYEGTAEESRRELSEFYRGEFQGVKSICGNNPDAARAVRRIRELGLKTAVATKPIFPDEAIVSRIEWAGLRVDDFEYFSSYEKCRYCKPNEMFYREVADAIGVDPCECLMVGNDVDEDLVAEKIGMKVFLLTDHVENKDGKDISSYRSGDYGKLLEYVYELLSE